MSKEKLRKKLKKLKDKQKEIDRSSIKNATSFANELKRAVSDAEDAISNALNEFDNAVAYTDEEGGDESKAERFYEEGFEDFNDGLMEILRVFNDYQLELEEFKNTSANTDAIEEIEMVV